MQKPIQFISSPEYPVLETLEITAKSILLKNFSFCSKVIEKREEEQYAIPEFEAIVFPQTWGSTTTGFDVTEDGLPAYGGSVITKAYTTVIHETLTDIWLIFFGNKFCYMIESANDEFYKDLQNMELASLSKAEKKYTKSSL